jgi:hypothetical protein
MEDVARAERSRELEAFRAAHPGYVGLEVVRD